MNSSLTIARRFNGPPNSGNGGWVAGSLAKALGAPVVEVSLRAPPPLDVPLSIRQTAPDELALHHGEQLLATALPVEMIIDVPAPPDFDSASAAGALGRLRAASRPNSPYVHCFVCGVARNDGLQILPGPLGDEGVVATNWTPDPSLGGVGGIVDVPTTWAALDCPAGIAWSHRQPDGAVMMTARMTARIDAPLRAGEPYIVTGWPITQQGRKLHAGTAIFSRAGTLHAVSQQLWLLPRS